MILKSSLCLVLLSMCALMGGATAAQAQNRYTFVSMTGNDANNCLFAETACRTFQRAHDVVSDGGTVAALDSGGYGPININKSVTITGEGVKAGITVTGSNVTGININTAGVVVRLRHLSITGMNTSSVSRGINYQNGVAVHVEHCVVTGFSFAGIYMNTAGHLYVSDSISRNNATGITLAEGTGAAPAPFGSITIERTLLEQNTRDGLATFGGRTTIRESRIDGNTSNGFFAAGAGVEVTMDDCDISHNGTGILNVGSFVRVANSTITNNGVGVAGANVLSKQEPGGFTNTLVGNGGGNAFTGTYTAQ